MICFYLVLFYTTLIMLSRQVRRGGPPCTRAQGSALFPTWSGSGAGPGCLGEPHRTQQGVLSPWVTFPRGPGGTRPRGGPGCRGC